MFPIELGRPRRMIGMRMEETDQQQIFVIRIRFTFAIHLIGDQNPIVLILDRALILESA